MRKGKCDVDMNNTIGIDPGSVDNWLRKYPFAERILRCIVPGQNRANIERVVPVTRYLKSDSYHPFALEPD